MILPQALPHIPVAISDRAHVSATLFHVVEYASVVVGALGGALTVRQNPQHKYDVTGVLGLGLLSGVGGGILRDLLLGDTPPLALHNPRYLMLALAGGFASLLFRSTVGPRVNALLLFIDAIGLGLFTVAGATRALDQGLSFLPCLLLGVITAVGGGSLRDVFSGQPPQIFQAGQLYALVSVVSAALFLVLVRLHVDPGAAASIAAIVAIVLRLLAIRFGWRTRALRVNP